LEEHRVLRMLFGPRTYEVTAGYRKLHSEEVHNLYSSPGTDKIVKSQEDEIGATCSILEEKKCVQNFGWKSYREDITRNTQTT
jgi:hypothetical protein